MKKSVILPLLMILLSVMLSGCSNNKIKVHTVDSMKDELIRLGYYRDDFQGYQAAGVSDIGGLINGRWMFVFYDYGDQKKALDDMMPVFIPDDMDSYIQTKNANYEIYQKETEQGGYVLYVRADDTLLSISGPGKDKEDIISFVTELGYYREN